MQKVELCSRCMALMRDAGYKVTENKGRGKVTCDHCRRRRYGAECDVEPPKKRVK